MLANKQFAKYKAKERKALRIHLLCIDLTAACSCSLFTKTNTGD